MNNTFDINRFFKLIRRHWLSNGKEYVLMVAVLLAILLYFYGNFAYKVFYNPDNIDLEVIYREFRGKRVTVFIILGALYMTYIASSSFKMYGMPSSVIQEIMLPASQLEKFLSAWLFSFVLAFVFYLALFFLIDLSFMSYIRTHFTSEHIVYWGDQKIVVDNLAYFSTVIMDESVGLQYWYTIAVVLNAFFLLGGIFFSRLQFIKSIISCAIYLAVFVLLFYFIQRFMFDGKVWLGHTAVENPVLISSILGWLLSISLWIITFVRLKEKEA